MTERARQAEEALQRGDSNTFWLAARDVVQQQHGNAVHGVAVFQQDVQALVAHEEQVRAYRLFLATLPLHLAATLTGTAAGMSGGPPGALAGAATGSALVSSLVQSAQSAFEQFPHAVKSSDLSPMQQYVVAMLDGMSNVRWQWLSQCEAEAERVQAEKGAEAAAQWIRVNVMPQLMQMTSDATAREFAAHAQVFKEQFLALENKPSLKPFPGGALWSMTALMNVDSELCVVRVTNLITEYAYKEEAQVLGIVVPQDRAALLQYSSSKSEASVDFGSLTMDDCRLVDAPRGVDGVPVLAPEKAKDFSSKREEMRQQREQEQRTAEMRVQECENAVVKSTTKVLHMRQLLDEVVKNQASCKAAGDVAKMQKFQEEICAQIKQLDAQAAQRAAEEEAARNRLERLRSQDQAEQARRQQQQCVAVPK